LHCLWGAGIVGRAARKSDVFKHATPNDGGRMRICRPRCVIVASLLVSPANESQAQERTPVVSAATLSSLRSVALSRPTRICGGTAHTNCGEGDVRLLSGNVRGRVAIVNSKDAVILRGDTTKELQLHSIGSGPGEWRAIGAIAVRVNGEILIYDPVLQRLTQYAPDGVVARSVVVSRPPGYNSARISANSLFILTWHGEDQPDIAIHQYDLATGKPSER